MSTAATPTIPSLTSDQLTVIVATFSSLVFFVVIVVLLIYRKDPHCCKFHCYQDSSIDLDAPPHYYSSRQTLVGPSSPEQTQDVTHNNTRSQSGQLFLIGLPSSYRLPSLEAPLPRLPSYESVRKKDRQRQIHMMIADRFGLNGPMLSEPPSYEESIRQSVEVPFDILGSVIDSPYCEHPPYPETEPTTQSGLSTLGSPTLGSPTLGSPTLGSPTLGSPTLGSPTLGSPTLGSPTQGSPTLGSPTLGSPTLGSPTLGSPTLGSPTQGSPTQGSPTQGSPSLDPSPQEVNSSSIPM